MSDQYVEYEFYFTDSDYADKVTKLYSEIELQNRYISIKNKSLLTHKDVETEQISIRFRNSVNYDKPLNYTWEIKTTEDINKIICSSIKELCIRAPVYNHRSPMAVVIYKLRDINPTLLKDTKLTDMCAITKDIILGSKGVSSANIQKYNISDSTAKLLALCVELNKLVNYPTREYLINYHITNKIDEYGPQWYNFTSTIQQQCILNCIDRINEAFTDQTIE